MSQAETNVIDFTARRNARLSGAAATLFPPRPDGEFVWRCEQLIEITNAIGMAHWDAVNDRMLEDALAPLDRQWRDVQDQLAELPLPTTGEGVRAAARMMMAYEAMTGPDDEGWSIELWALLSLACARYLTGEVA